MQFKENLKYLRNEKSLTQKELSNLCGVSPTCICQLETGARSPTGLTLLALADFFDCSIDYLMGRSNEDTISFTSSPIADERLAQEEKELIDNFRKLDFTDQLRINGYLNALLEKYKAENKIGTTKKQKL